MRRFGARSILLVMACAIGCHADGTEEPPSTRARFGGPIGDFPRGRGGADEPAQEADAPSPPAVIEPPSSGGGEPDESPIISDDGVDDDTANGADAGGLLGSGPAPTPAMQHDASADGDAGTHDASAASDDASTASSDASASGDDASAARDAASTADDRASSDPGDASLTSH